MKTMWVGLFVLSGALAVAAPLSAQAERVSVESDGWALVGDLELPGQPGPHPAVLMLNQAAGRRTAYTALAAALRERGMASLRLDMRGHGESTNQGSFVPGASRRDPLIWDSEPDVAAALDFLRHHPSIDPERLAVVGASYSGEEASESGHLHGYARAYVLLSPGSLSDASIGRMEGSGAEWLVVSAEEDGRLTEIMAAVTDGGVAEYRLLSGRGHATDLFEGRPELPATLADWLEQRIAGGQ